jgi:hypothetical protein
MRPVSRQTAAAITGAAALALVAAAPAWAAPAKGDWEASGKGGQALASFAVANAAERSHGRVTHVLSVQDVVVQAPIQCTNAFSTPLPIDVEVIGGSFALGPGGKFASTPLKRGRGGTSVSGSFHGGRFTITYRHLVRTLNPYEGSDEVCDTGSIHLTARRGHRAAHKNGIWEGQSSQQEPTELSVVAGGRALEAPVGAGPGGTREYAFQLAPSNANDACAYQITYPLFVAANGTFSNAATRLGDEAVLSGRFTGAGSVAGQFSNLEESCPQEGWNASWRFNSR